MSAADDMRASFLKWIRDDGYICPDAVTEIEWDDEGLPVYYTLDDGKRHWLDGEWHAWQAAIAAEREAAAKVCDDRARAALAMQRRVGGFVLGDKAAEAKECAAAIRARGAS